MKYSAKVFVIVKHFWKRVKTGDGTWRLVTRKVGENREKERDDVFWAEPASSPSTGRCISDSIFDGRERFRRGIGRPRAPAGSVIPWWRHASTRCHHREPPATAFWAATRVPLRACGRVFNCYIRYSLFMHHRPSSLEGTPGLPAPRPAII